MKRCTLQFVANVYKAHLYRSCNYGEKKKSYPMKVGGGEVPRGFEVGEQLPPLPPPPPGSCVLGVEEGEVANQLDEAVRLAPDFWPSSPVGGDLHQPVVHQD